MGLSGAHFTLAELEALGVKRVSVGSALARAAYGAFLAAGREVRERGTFTFADHAAPYADLNAMFKQPRN
jgi:2-methylisocitrate lyase-like PEP mutase family enzyme